jgi:twinkle protein
LKSKAKGAEHRREILNVVDFTKGMVGSIADRNISKDTCKFYGVSCILDDTQQILKQIYPYYQGHNKVAQKIRTVAEKTFFIEGTLNNKSELFGQQLFGSHNKKYLIVTEGELDAMAAYQMVGGIYASVSIPNGAQSAVTAFKANWDFINLFDHIVIAFDNDEQGREAATKVASLFETGKAKVLKFTQAYKDACDMLKADKGREFIQLVYNSEVYKPEGIVDLYDLKDKFLERRKKLVQSHRLYPFPCLNKATYGIRQGELVIVTAPTGVGKTSFLREVQDHILNTTQD